MKNCSIQKLALYAIVFCVRSTPLSAEEPGQVAPMFNGRTHVSLWIHDKVGAPHEVKRAILFNNVPCLHLKHGDRLVKGKYWFKYGKSEKPHFAKTETYFLFSQGKYYGLEAREGKSNQLLLESACQSLLFDWKVDLQLARQLVGGAFDESITLASFAKLEEALRKDFPETLCNVDKVKIQKPHLDGSGATRRAIFQGLGFDEYRNTVGKYQLEVGKGIYKLFRKNLIVGPRRVEREEFEGLHMSGPNAAADYTPTPEAAAKARAAYERMTKFQAIVNKFLTRPRLNRSS